MQKIYVETWGNDDTGDGSKSNPYANVNKAYVSVTEECTIYLGEGTFYDNLDTLPASYNVSLVGKIGKTVLYITGGSSWKVLQANKIINIEFSFGNVLCIAPKVNGDDMIIENCTFVGESSYLFIDNSNSTYYFYKCLFKLPTMLWGNTSYKPNVVCKNCATTSSDDDYFQKNENITAYNCKINYTGTIFDIIGGYLLFMNNKYYSILPAHYVDGAYQEVDLATVKADEDASDNYLFSPSALFEDLTIGEDESAVTFKPIEKFDNFQLVDINSEELPDPLTISGLKVNNAMIAMIVPVSMKKYNVIHSVTATYEGTVRLAFSFDKGTTWKTFNTTDGVWEDLFIDIALKDYASYTVNDKTNWNTAKAKILTDGIDPADLEITDLINFNINAKTMLVAAAMERNDYDTPASFSGLTILYDSPNTYERVESTECKVAITGDTIEVTPTFDNNELLITAVTNL